MLDIAIARDKTNDYKALEVILPCLVNGCNFGKLCLYASKEPRKW